MRLSTLGIELAYRRIHSKSRGPLVPHALLTCTLCSWTETTCGEEWVSISSGVFTGLEFWSTAWFFYSSKTCQIWQRCGSQTRLITWETCHADSWAPFSSGNSESVSQKQSPWSTSSCSKVWKGMVPKAIFVLGCWIVQLVVYWTKIYFDLDSGIDHLLEHFVQECSLIFQHCLEFFTYWAA